MSSFAYDLTYFRGQERDPWRDQTIEWEDEVLDLIGVFGACDYSVMITNKSQCATGTSEFSVTAFELDATADPTAVKIENDGSCSWFLITTGCRKSKNLRLRYCTNIQLKSNLQWQSGYPS